MEVIPLSEFPLTGFSTVIASTNTIAELPSVTPLTALEKSMELARSMEEMTLQESEIKRMEK